jgi:hypothetical protein
MGAKSWVASLVNRGLICKAAVDLGGGLATVRRRAGAICPLADENNCARPRHQGRREEVPDASSQRDHAPPDYEQAGGKESVRAGCAGRRLVNGGFKWKPTAFASLASRRRLRNRTRAETHVCGSRRRTCARSPLRTLCLKPLEGWLSGDCQPVARPAAVRIPR